MAAIDDEQAIRRALAELVSDGPDPAARHGDVDARLEHHQRHFVLRRRVLVGSAAVAATGGVIAWTATNNDQNGRVQAGPSTARTTKTEDWQRIEPAPLDDRTSPAVVWTGDRLIVWSGGVAGGEEYLRHPDGTAWSPIGSWESIAPAPAGVIRGGFAVWDGSEMLVGLLEGDARAPWNDQASEWEPLYGIAAYDPGADRWRYVAPILGDSEARFGNARQAVFAPGGLVVAVRTALPSSPQGREVVFVNTTTGQTAPIEPGPFALSPYADSSGEVTLTAVGDVILGTPNWDLRPWTLDPSNWTWRQAGAPPGARSLHLLPPTAAGDVAVYFESDGPIGNRAWRFDPSIEGDAGWRPVSPKPFDTPAWTYNPVWSGAEVFIPGGAYDPTTDTWREVAAPPRGANRQRTLNATWTGSALLLFGGEEYTCPDDSTCDREPGPDTLDGWILANP